MHTPITPPGSHGNIETGRDDVVDGVGNNHQGNLRRGSRNRTRRFSVYTPSNYP